MIHRRGTEGAEKSICPRCGSARVQKSRRRGSLERLLGMLGARVRRCHACRVRYARWLGRTIYLESFRRSLRHYGRLVLVLGGTAVFLILLLWVVSRQSGVPEGG